MSAASYRFGDASRPGVLLGLSGRQAVPLVAGVLWMAFAMQTSAPLALVLSGPAVGLVVAFGRWRGIPMVDVAVPATRLWWTLRTGSGGWVRASLTAGPNAGEDLPRELAGLELLEGPAVRSHSATPAGVVWDRPAGTITGVLRVRGDGFALASQEEQDTELGGWGAALAPFARERGAVTRVSWQEWAHTVGTAEHDAFLDERGVTGRDDPAAADYLALVHGPAAASVTHEVLVCVTVDMRRVRARRAIEPLDAGIEVLVDELRLFAERLDVAGLNVEGPLNPTELALLVRLRSDPTRAATLTALSRSLAMTTGRAPVEWGPMAVSAHWGRVRVDGTEHRSYRVATWPGLPVGADWLGPLLGAPAHTRTVTVVMEPVPLSRAARAADREVMGREADHDMKERRGFRVSARDRKRLEDVTTREAELAEGHPEFRFLGLVDVAAADLDALDRASAWVEQSAAQCLLDLRPLEARHDLGWVASLPLGRNIAPSGTIR